MKKTGTKNKKRRPKGTGSIYYVASRKRYAGQTQVDLGGGKTKTKTVYGKTKTEVADKLKELERQSIRGEYIEKDKTVFYDFAEMLFNEQLELNEVRQSTYDRKMATLKMLSAISDYEIQDMDEKMIKDFIIRSQVLTKCINCFPLFSKRRSVRRSYLKVLCVILSVPSQNRSKSPLGL